MTTVPRKPQFSSPDRVARIVVLIATGFVALLIPAHAFASPLGGGGMAVIAISSGLSTMGGMLTASVLVMAYRRQRRRANLEQTRLTTLVQGSSDAIIGQTLDGRITDWNPAAVRMFGYPAREAVGQMAGALILPPNVATEDADLLARVASGEFVQHFTTRRRTRGGRIMDVVITALPIYGSDGRIAGVSKTIRDVSEQKAAVMALSDAQVRLALATQAAGVGLWDWDINSNTLHWDDVMFSLYGVPRESLALAYDTWKTLVHPDDLEATECSIGASIEAREPLDVSFRIRTPAGEPRHLRAKGAVSGDAPKGALRMIGATIDITREKAREHEIESLNATLERQVAARTAEISRISIVQRAVLANSAHGIMATDVNGVMTVFNPAAERMYGYRAEDVIGAPTSAIPYDEAEMAARAETLTIELGHPVEHGFEVFIAKARLGMVEAHEWTCLHKDGSRRPTMLSTTAMRGDDGEVLGYLAILVDLSERVAKEQALKERERFLKAVTHHSPTMVGYWDANLRCCFANEAYGSRFGGSATEMLGTAFTDLMDGELFRLNKGHIEAALRGEVQSFGRELAGADGRKRHVWGHYVPDCQGTEVRGFYSFVSDVTEITEARINLERLNEDLRRKTLDAEAAAGAKGLFLANMSHEIRTPINGVLGMLQLLARTPMSHKQADYANKAYVATKSLMRLLNDILDFSKLEAGQVRIETVDFKIDTLMREIVADFGTAAGPKSLQLEYRIDKAAPKFVRGDVFRLRQVLLNLVGNAIKFTEQGCVSVSVRRRGEAGGRSELEFSVEDTGIGIAPDNLRSVFKGFTQAEDSTTRRYGGTGLGLSISHQLVSLMGGLLEVESTLGVGSRFSFTLVLETGSGFTEDAAAVSSHGLAAPWRSNRRRLAGLRILVADDQELNRQIAYELLSDEGAVVELASDGVAAVALALTATPPFDVILMDMQMPEMDGCEATRRIRAAASADAPPIIALTAGAMASEKADCLAAGMVDHIAKPLDMDVVVDTLLAVWRRQPTCGQATCTEPHQDEPIDVERLLGQLGWDKPTFGAMWELFISQGAAKLDKLRGCLADEDIPGAINVLNAFRTMAQTAGLTSLAASFTELEVELESLGRPQNIPRLMRDIEIKLAAGVQTIQRGL